VGFTLTGALVRCVNVLSDIFLSVAEFDLRRDR
jgi:hypothetical protein